jgi:hypothetical protein
MQKEYYCRQKFLFEVSCDEINLEEHYASKYLNMPISSDKEWARLVKQFEGSEDDCLIFNSKGRGETYGKE